MIVGALIYGASKLNLPFGHLPGDIVFHGENVTVFIPCATAIVLSILLTIILNLILRYLNK